MMRSSNQLFNAVTGWLKDKGVTQNIIGPVNFSTNEPCGLLVEGFDSPPVLMDTYNPSYYIDLVEKQGYTKTN